MINNTKITNMGNNIIKTKQTIILEILFNCFSVSSFAIDDRETKNLSKVYCSVQTNADKPRFIVKRAMCGRFF